MTTEYTQIATIAVPDPLIPDANQLALCLGESAADDQTFGAATYQDDEGNLYAVCSTVAKPVLQKRQASHYKHLTTRQRWTWRPLHERRPSYKLTEVSLPRML